MQNVLRSYKQIKCPTLLLWGEHDPIIPLSSAKKLLSEIPGAQIKVLPNCGHVPQEELPGPTAQAISEYLSMLPKYRF